MPPVEDGLPYPGLSPDANAVLATLVAARDRLARLVVQENYSIPGPVLNSTIISTILQALFLSVGGRSGFAGPGMLALLAESDGIAKRMVRACLDAGLPEDIFFPGPEGSRGPAAVPDAALRELIGSIGLPAFSASCVSLSPEDFALVFEHLLGTRMEIAEGYHVRRTGKSAVLYTGTVDVPPRPVVEAVVHDTLWEILRDSVRSAGTIRVLDPACGAGIFLLAAYRFLAGHDDGSKEEILCRSIFGVDIDPESVSAARFVLLLAGIDTIRGTESGTVPPERVRAVCSCLAMAIRSGNTLIAPDYFSGKPVFPFNAEEYLRVNAFDWKGGFPEIPAAGGFDVILSAPPPYRPFSVKSRDEYFQTHYDVYSPSAGLYGYFIEKGLTLLRHGGTMAVLLPGTFLRSRPARPLRRLLLSRQIVMIADTGRTRAIQDGEARMYILRLRNEPPARPFLVARWPAGGPESPVLSGMHGFTLDQRSLDDGGWNLEDTRTTDLLEKLRGIGTPLDTYVMGEYRAGSIRIRNNSLVVDPATRTRLTKKAWWCRKLFATLVRPADIRRYVPETPSRFLIAIANEKDSRKCREVGRYLMDARSAEKNASPEDRGEESDTSTESPATGMESGHKQPKILFPLYQHGPAFCYDPKGSYALATGVAAIPRDDPFLAAILNSSLGRFIITHTCPLTDRGYHLSPAHLGKFPMIAPDFDKRTDRTRYEKIVALVAQIMSLHEYLHKTTTDQEQRLVRQEIDATDVKIDALVYELYGLSAEEIATVEESAIL